MRTCEETSDIDAAALATGGRINKAAAAAAPARTDLRIEELRFEYSCKRRGSSKVPGGVGMPQLARFLRQPGRGEAKFAETCGAWWRPRARKAPRPRATHPRPRLVTKGTLGSAF